LFLNPDHTLVALDFDFSPIGRGDPLQPGENLSRNVPFGHDWTAALADRLTETEIDGMQPNL
jgi:hypothetical protein